MAQRLGNLALIEKSINASLSNRPFSEKRAVFKQSKLLLTRSIAERPKVGTNTRIDLAVKDLQPFDEGRAVAEEEAPLIVNDAAKDRRFRSHLGIDPIGLVRAAWQNMLTGLAQDVWQVH